MKRQEVYNLQPLRCIASWCVDRLPEDLICAVSNATLLLLGMVSTAALAQQSNEPKKEKKPRNPMPPRRSNAAANQASGDASGRPDRPSPTAGKPTRMTKKNITT